MAAREPRGRELGRERAARVDRAEVERRNDRVRRVRADHLDDRPNDGMVGRVGVGFPREALHLDVDEQSLARGKRFEQRRHVGTRRTERVELVRADQSEARDFGVVMHNEHVVGGPARVELDPVGTELTCARERRNGVFWRGTRRATMCQNQRSLGHDPASQHRNAFQL